MPEMSGIAYCYYKLIKAGLKKLEDIPASLAGGKIKKEVEEALKKDEE